MAAFIDNYDSAKNSYSQSSLQLNQARNQLGTMGNQIADLYYPGAQETYAKVLGSLERAQTSADTGYQYTNLMKPEANTADRRLIVTQLDQTYFDLTAGIQDVRNSATTLGVQAANGEFKNRTLTSVEDLPDDSAGLIVKREQQAEAENANVQSPPGEASIVENGDVRTVPQAGDESNADRTPLASNAEFGPNSNNNLVAEVGSNRVPTPATQTQGVCAAPDDYLASLQKATGTATSAGAGGRPAIPPGFTAPIIPTPNKLAGMASQTYSISIYLTSDAENQAIRNGQKISFPANSLIIQSGGINSSTAQNQRNKYFDVDFYIDEVEIESQPGTQGSGSAHNVNTMKMRISEPNGITLIDRLDKAVREYAKLGNVPVTATSQNYVMIIRFYGYDQDGKLITGEQLGLSSLFYGSDKTSIVEKWIPFTIVNIRYQITTKGVDYDIDMAVTQTNTMFSSNFGGAIPFNIELVSGDLKTLFNGPVAYAAESSTKANTTTTTTGAGETTTAPAAAATATTTTTTGAAPPKANASATKTITQGLANALNQYYQELVKNGQQEIADQYEIQLYESPGLIDATLIKQGSQDKTRSPMNLSKDASQQLLSSKNNYDKDSKNYNITAGTQIVQVIDLAMRSSSFITKQQTITYDEKTQQPIAQKPAATTMWYRIQGTTIPLGYDRKRRSTAYKFVYLITPYQINDPRSSYFDPAKYRGVHKVYNYWFTGQNSEVLDFVIDVNYNYLQVVGANTPVSSTFSGRWAEKRAFQTRPNESSQGGTGTSTMPAAQLADRLYSSGDVMKCELTILGDPDWLSQSEVFYLRPNFDAFCPDGSVNTAGSEVLYEVRFNRPTDIDLNTGLTPVFKNNVAFSAAAGDVNLPQESIVYSANIIKSYFKGGKFTQKLSGTVKSFSQDSQAAAAAVNGDTTVDTKTSATIAPVANTPSVTSPAAINDDSDNINNYLDGGLFSGGTVNKTGTGTPLSQPSKAIQVDANKTQVSPSAPVPTTAGMAPSDDSGWSP